MESFDPHYNDWLKESNDSGEFLNKIISTIDSPKRVRPKIESKFIEIQTNRSRPDDEMRLVARKIFFKQGSEIVNIYALPNPNEETPAYVSYYVEVIHLCGMTPVKEFFEISTNK